MMLITHSVEEAVFLASRIVVVTARPARVKDIVAVPFAYPRTEQLRERQEFAELRARVGRLVMDEYSAPTTLAHSFVPAD
ncbi:putative ABC transporter, ATP-binding protein (fragment) [Bradyrhizobium sp. STM 3809]